MDCPHGDTYVEMGCWNEQKYLTRRPNTPQTVNTHNGRSYSVIPPSLIVSLICSWQCMAWHIYTRYTKSSMLYTRARHQFATKIIPSPPSPHRTLCPVVHPSAGTTRSVCTDPPSWHTAVLSGISTPLITTARSQLPLIQGSDPKARKVAPDRRPLVTLASTTG